MFVDGGHRLDRHRVRDHVLYHVTGWRQQRRDDKPYFDPHDFGHRLRMRDNAVHDQDAQCNQCGADINQQCFAAPDQVDQVPQRHFQRPRDTHPECQAGEKSGGKVQVLLDEKGTDYRGQSLYARSQVNH